ncbi:hypothetical protein ANRL3_00292 [Anaerolineae bacterium]|nr:hypothetical protein ANRL3_00292 [Anaerolineae bacterium]
MKKSRIAKTIGCAVALLVGLILLVCLLSSGAFGGSVDVWWHSIFHSSDKYAIEELFMQLCTAIRNEDYAAVYGLMSPKYQSAKPFYYLRTEFSIATIAIKNSSGYWGACRLGHNYGLSIGNDGARLITEEQEPFNWSHGIGFDLVKINGRWYIDDMKPFVIP